MIGTLQNLGRVSGAQVESPIAYALDFKTGKIIRVWTYFDPNEALEAGGLPE